MCVCVCVTRWVLGCVCEGCVSVFFSLSLSLSVCVCVCVCVCFSLSRVRFVGAGVKRALESFFEAPLFALV